MGRTVAVIIREKVIKKLIINLKLFFLKTNKLPRRKPNQADREFVSIVDIEIPKMKK